MRFVVYLAPRLRGELLKTEHGHRDALPEAPQAGMIVRDTVADRILWWSSEAESWIAAPSAHIAVECARWDRLVHKAILRERENGGPIMPGLAISPDAVRDYRQLEPMDPEDARRELLCARVVRI